MSYCTSAVYCVDIRTYPAEVSLIREYLDGRKLNHHGWYHRKPVIISDGKERKLRDRISFYIRFKNCDECHAFLQYMQSLDANTMIMTQKGGAYISYNAYFGRRNPEKYGHWRFTRSIAQFPSSLMERRSKMKSTTVTKLLSIGTLTLTIAGNILGNMLAKRQLKEAVAEEVANQSKHTSETE